MNEKEQLITSLIAEGYLKTPAIIEAFRAIDRKDFVPRGRGAALRGVPDNLDELAYINEPLPIGHGQTISQPLTVAFLLELLEPKPGEHILDVGSGSGWTSALLAHAVSGVKSQESRKSGEVVAVERIPELCKFGETNVGKYNFVKKGVVRFICGDATLALEGAEKFDKILSGAAAQDAIPEEWKKQLATHGRIVAPVGQSVVVLDKISEKKFETKEYHGFSFVPLMRD